MYFSLGSTSFTPGQAGEQWFTLVCAVQLLVLSIKSDPCNPYYNITDKRIHNGTSEVIQINYVKNYEVSLGWKDYASINWLYKS